MTVGEMDTRWITVIGKGDEMTTNGTLIVQNGNALDFTEDKIDLIKRTVAEKATDLQLQLFLHQAQKTGLDPLAKQIHCVLRYNRDQKRYDMSIQTAIDGYRLIADRTGKYAGSDDYLFDNGMSQFEHIKNGGSKYPSTATVTVYKIAAGVRCPFTATAEWTAYYPGDKQGFMWRKMPYLMLGKCAEALALRKAFPAELSGVYVREEMEQAGFSEVEPEPTGTGGYGLIEDGEIVDDEPPAIIEELRDFAEGDDIIVVTANDEKPAVFIGQDGSMAVVKMNGKEAKVPPALIKAVGE